jgi:hypothetical protein
MIRISQIKKSHNVPNVCDHDRTGGDEVSVVNIIRLTAMRNAYLNRQFWIAYLANALLIGVAGRHLLLARISR